MKKFFLFFVVLILHYSLFSQDTIYIHQVLKKLCSPEFGGRGYLEASDKKAAYYIQEEFNKFGLKAYDSSRDHIGVYQKNYLQAFSIAVNTFPDNVVVRFDKKTSLKPGVDFILDPSSPGIPKLTTYQVVRLQKKNIKSDKDFDNFFYADFSKNCIVIDPDLFKKEIETNNEFYKRVLKNEMRADAIIILESNKLTFGVSGRLDKYPTIHIMKDKFPPSATEIMVQYDNNFNVSYQTQNVIGLIKGKKHPDSIIVIGAHYDHLGEMGPNTIFEGANDNASGVAMMLDLAKYYSDPFNTPDYSIAFIAFGAEELGLLGSAYFTEHPLFPLSKIAFMINLDMLGTGEKGMMVVNATKNRAEFTMLKNINAQKKYLVDIQSRGPAANSDQYSFDVKNVKAVYLYLMGDYPYYHDVNDVVEKLTLGGYVGSFKLITDFLTQFQK